MLTCTVHENCVIIFRRYRRGSNGRVLDAKDFGYQAWPIHKRKT